MLAYKFYCLDPTMGYQLFGLLPERRRDMKRITHESIMNWGKALIGENIDCGGVFFINTEIDENIIEAI